MESRWQTLIGLFSYALDVESKRELMLRYHTNWSKEELDSLNKGMTRSATEQWLLAKKMYCLDKDYFDDWARTVSSRQELQTFEAARQVIEEEMKTELETQILKEDV